MTKYTVTRTVHLIQAIVVKADSPSQAKELARKSKFKEFSTLDNKKRTDYSVTPVTQS